VANFFNNARDRHGGRSIGERVRRLMLFRHHHRQTSAVYESLDEAN